MAGFSGLMVIDASTAGVTVSDDDELTVPELIAMLVLPMPTLVARPAVGAELLIVATPAPVELQCPVCVRSWVLPSVKVPVAVNCCVKLRAILAVLGEISIETSCAAVTVKAVEPLMDPEAAEMFAVP